MTSKIFRLRIVLGNVLFGGGLVVLLIVFGMGSYSVVTWLIGSAMIIAGFFVGESWRILRSIVEMLGGPTRL